MAPEAARDGGRPRRPAGHGWRRGRGARVAGALLLAPLVACANLATPPGGPPDTAIPKLLSATPADRAVNVKAREAVFRFDEVISETPRGAPDLAGLVFISPRAKSTSVSWKRTAIGVRPAGGFRPNTVYTVTLAPGIVDLRGNARDSATTIVFATGPVIPSTAIAGVAFDWPAAKGAGKAIVEAIAPDSTTYVTIADSVGRFRLSAIPPGAYVLRGFVDGNTNRRLDPREAFDTVRVTLADSLRLELYAFVQDTLPVRIASVTPVGDSLRQLKVTFDKPLALDVPLEPARFTLKRADSSLVRIAAVRTAAAEAAREDSLRKAAADSARRAEEAARVAKGLPPVDSAKLQRAADSVAALRDSVERARRRLEQQRAAGRGRGARPGPPPPPPDTTPPPKPGRPIPPTELILTLDSALAPGRGYRLVATEVRGLVGRPRSAERAFATPRPDTTRARGDARAPLRPDSAAGRPTPGDSAAGRPPARPAGAADSIAPPRKAPPAGGPPAEGKRPVRPDTALRPPPAAAPPPRRR